MIQNVGRMRKQYCIRSVGNETLACWNDGLTALDLGHSIVSSSRTARPCSPWGGRWIGHQRSTWSTVCSSAPHSQAAEEAITHLYKQERKRPTQVGRRLNQTQALLGRVIPGGGCQCRGWKCKVVWGFRSTPHSIGDPLTAQHVCCFRQMNWWDVVWRLQMGVSLWAAVHCTRWTGERWVEQMSKLHGTAC